MKGTIIMKKIISILLTFVFALSLAFVCVAADATPSVTAKSAPELVSVDSSNPDIIAKIVNGSDTTGVTVGKLVVTSHADRNDASETIKANLEKAYNDLIDGKLDSVIKKAAKKLNKDYTEKNLIATDVFDIDLSSDYKETLAKDGAYISVRFKTSKVPAVVLHLDTNTNEWLDVGAENIKDNGDGTVTVNFSSLCPVIFLSVNEDAPIEPASSNTWLIVLLCVIAAIVIVVIIVCVVGSKKKSVTDSKNGTKTQK